MIVVPNAGLAHRQYSSPRASGGILHSAKYSPLFSPASMSRKPCSRICCINKLSASPAVDHMLSNGERRAIIVGRIAVSIISPAMSKISSATTRSYEPPWSLVDAARTSHLEPSGMVTDLRPKACICLAPKYSTKIGATVAWMASARSNMFAVESTFTFLPHG